MSFEQHQEGPEVIQDVLRSAVNVINDDFDYDKFIQVFPSDPWLSKGKSIPNLAQVQPDMQAHHDNLRSCPPMHHNVFTFDDSSLTPKNQYPQVQKMDTGSSDKMKAMMNKPQVRKSVNEVSGKSGQNNAAPILKVQITGNPNYELDESDLLNMFSRYGKVLRIELTRHRTAYIVYDDMINALFAQKNLNGHYVRNLDIKMYVSWSNNLEEELMRVEAENRAQMANTNNIGSLGNIGSLTNLNNNNINNVSGSYNALNISQYSNGSNGVSKSLPNLDAMNVNFPYNSAKFTCKYEIQINNDKDFKIARKIIGPKGCNMKKIIEICQYTLKRSDTNFGNDFLKLRLRGRGSGFKEGPEQKESDEALHLCVSSKFQEVYNLACKLVEDLVGGLYKEYEKFCAKQGRPLSEPVQIKRIDIYNGTEKKPEEFKDQGQRSRQNSLDMSLSHQFTKSLSMIDHNMGGESLSAISDKENYSPKTNIMHGNGPLGQTDFTKTP